MSVTTLSYSPKPTDFKDDSGRWRTKSLFMETNDNETKYPSIFTLGPEDKDGRVSMRSIYLKCGDPTEYKAALSILGSFDAWIRLSSAPFFKPHLEQWRAELQRRIKSQAVHTIEDIALGSKTTASQLNAAKWLASQEWVGPSPKTNKMGRPPKELDPTEALRDGLRNDEEDQEDFDRIFKASDN